MNPAEIKNYFHKLKSLKKIDGLINNIGIAGPTKSLENIKIEEWEETIKTNLHSHFYYTKYSIPFLKKAKKSSVINLSSTAGLYGFAQRSPYTASKWAVIGLTKTLAMELGKYKIRVNAVAPGVIRTPLTERYFQDKEVAKKINGIHAMNRVGEPEEVSNPVRFLASDESTFCTGSILTVDGGWTAGKFM